DTDANHDARLESKRDALLFARPESHVELRRRDQLSVHGAERVTAFGQAADANVARGAGFARTRRAERCAGDLDARSRDFLSAAVDDFDPNGAELAEHDFVR